MCVKSDKNLSIFISITVSRNVLFMIMLSRNVSVLMGKKMVGETSVQESTVYPVSAISPKSIY
jgi:hypothetical protein